MTTSTIETLNNSAALYKFYAICFYPPDGENAVNQELIHDAIKIAAGISPEVKHSLLSLEQSFQGLNPQDLLVDYAGLFIGPFSLLAPPYSSTYLGNEKRLMTDVTLKVLNAYEEAGLSMEESLHQPPDHIAVELEFMHYLLVCEAAALKDGNRESQAQWRKRYDAFFNNHLSQWVGEFCTQIRNGAQSPFYKTLSDSLELFLLHS